MWYYSKDEKEKKGPMSDSALPMLLARGEITKSTSVWTPSQKSWLPLEESDVYEKVTSRGKSRHLLTLQKYTIFFRALLISLFALVTYTLWFYNENVIQYKEFLLDGDNIDNTTKFIVSSENRQTQKLLKYIVFLLLSATAFFGYKWVKVAIINTKMLAKRTAYSATFSAYSFVIPFINLIIPKHIISEILSASLSTANSRKRTPYIILIFTWHIFWVASILMLLVSLLLKTSSCSADQFFPVYYTKIFFFATHLVTISLSIAIISIVLWLQKKALKKR